MMNKNLAMSDEVRDWEIQTVIYELQHLSGH